MLRDISTILDKLASMSQHHIWPNGQRYLWTDAFGVVLLVSLYRELEDECFLYQAEWVVSEVERVLGQPRGIRIGKVPEEDGQYFHYLAMWIYALHRLGVAKPEYHQRAITLAKDIHHSFVLPGRGVIWKMNIDLSAPYPGYGFGGLDHFHGYVVYRLLATPELSSEIEDMRQLVTKSYQNTTITQDLGLGMMLWMTHFFPEEPWAQVQRERSSAVLDELWIDPPGYFCREPFMRDVKFPFTNYGISLGLQAAGIQYDRVVKLNRFFDTYKAGNACDVDAINHVMACTSHFPGDFLKTV